MKMRFSFPDSPWTGLLAGGIFFLLVFGIKALDTANIDWLMAGDPAQQYLGWDFFRNEAWHIPPGRMDSFGVPEGSAVVFSDSLPVFAILFKVFRGMLPATFQYIGIWLALCYLLQGLFGWWLAAKASSHPPHRFFFTCFFILSPIMLFRAEGAHSLAAHWILLSALIFWWRSTVEAGDGERRPNYWGSWAFLLSLAVLTNFYLCAMVLGIYLANLSSFFLSGRDKGSLVVSMVICSLAIWASMYLGGYFAIPTHEASADGYGYFSMNLMQPFNPMGNCDLGPNKGHHSFFLTPVSRATGGQYEGYSYMGSGFLALACLFTVLLFFKRDRHKFKVLWERWGRSFGPLVLILVLFTLLAVTNHVTLGPWSLFHISHNFSFAVLGLFFLFLIMFVLKNRSKIKNLSKRSKLLLGSVALITVSFAFLAFLDHIFGGSRLWLGISSGHYLSGLMGIFRSSGRFFWVPFYCIMFGVFWGLGRIFKGKEGRLSLLLAVTLLLQTIDLLPEMRYAFEGSHPRAKYVNPLSSPFWKELEGHYQEMLYYPEWDLKYFVPLGLVAADNKMATNLAYRARFDHEMQDRSQEKILEEFRTANLRQGALYVFSDAQIFRELRSSVQGRRLFLKKVDGLYVAARRSVERGQP